PSRLQAEGLDRLVCEKLDLPLGKTDLGEWLDLTERLQQSTEEVEIALVGKYVKLQDAYLSVHEALKHAGAHQGCRVRVRWVDAARRAGRRARGGDARARGVRRGGHPRAAPPPLRGEQPLPAGAGRRRAPRLRHLSGGPARRARRARRPPMVRREPVPSGVQVAADAPRAAV